MRYLSLGEILDLHRALRDQTGGATGIRDLAGLESALLWRNHARRSTEWRSECGVAGRGILPHARPP
jgi:hypothetical protein